MESEEGGALKADAGDHPRVPLGVPHLYADKVIDVVYGLSTSKIVFGNEMGGSAEQATLVLTIPSPALFVTVRSIAANMMSEDFVDETEMRHRSIVSMMRGRDPDAEPVKVTPAPD